MPRNLADRATFLMVFPTAEFEAKVIAMAQQFGFIVVDDTMLVIRGDATLGKKVTIYAKREVRQEFNRLVTDLAMTLGHDGGMPFVLVDVNGSAAVYEVGVDYEPSSVSKEPNSPSV